MSERERYAVKESNGYAYVGAGITYMRMTYTDLAGPLWLVRRRLRKLQRIADRANAAQDRREARARELLR